MASQDLDDHGQEKRPAWMERGPLGRGLNKHQWKQAVPINIGKLNELSIFAKYGSVLGTDPGNITIWERQNEIVCSPWNWAKTMSTGSAGILEGGVEAQYLELGRSMHQLWMSRISEVAQKGKLSCMTEFMYALKAFVVLMLNLWQPLVALPAILYIAILIAEQFGSAGGFLVIALFNDVMFGEEMDLLRFYYGGKIKWGLQLDFGFWDFLKRGFREVVGEESDIGEAISTQDEADFGRKHAIHRFVINLFQTAVSYAEYVLVIGTGLSELLADIYWEGGGEAEEVGTDPQEISISEESSPTSRFLYLIPGVMGVGYSVLIFWILVIFEIVFLYHCVILVPRTTGKETTRSVYGDIIAGICKGRVVFRGCALSRMWLLVRGYVKKTNHKSGNVVDACDEMKTFMLFLHWLGDNGWISAKMEGWTICKIKTEGGGINNTAFLEEVEDADDDENSGLIKKMEKQPSTLMNNPMTEVSADGFSNKSNVSDLELTESVKGSSDQFKNRIQSIKSKKSTKSRKSRGVSNKSVHSLLESWLEGSIDTKERAAFGFSEYLVGTVSWLLGVEQILANVGHKLDENGNEVPLYKIHKNYEKGAEFEYTSHRWLFDGKAAVKDRIGSEMLRGGVCNWLKLALQDPEQQIPFKDGDLGLMIFGGISESHELRKSEIYELDELKAVLGRKVRAKWLAGGIMLVTKSTTTLSESAKAAKAVHFATSVTFGTAELEEIRNLGRLWPEETARWRELVRKWDMSTQDAVIYGQEQVTTRRGNRIIAAVLSVTGEKVTITVRKTMLPLEDQGNDIWCIS